MLLAVDIKVGFKANNLRSDLIMTVFFFYATMDLENDRLCILARKIVCIIFRIIILLSKTDVLAQ